MYRTRKPANLLATLEAVLGRFLQSLLPTGHRSDLAGQPNLTEHHQILGQRSVSETGNDGRQQRQIGTGFQHLDAAHHIHKDILIPHLQTAVTV